MKIIQSKVLFLALAGMLAGIGFLLLKLYSLEHPSSLFLTVPQITRSMNLWTVFLTGLLTGGLTCLAVQGGLLAATIAQVQERKLKDTAQKTGNALPILAFLSAKLVAYTMLGFLLGWIGSAVQLSLTATIIMQLGVGIFMIGTALNILNVHPIFRYFVIQPPKFLRRFVRLQSKSASVFAPLLLGASTVFIPCGTTQAMMALAIGSANPFLGAAILFVFVLGTSPVFFTIGYLATKLGDTMHQYFMRAAAVALLLLAVFTINGAIALTGSNYTLETMWDTLTSGSNVQGISTPVEEATITFESTRYTPADFAIKAGSKVTLRLVNSGGKGCIQAFTIPKLGIQKVVPFGSSDTIQFTAPREQGELAFMCSMGMYRGVIHVI